MTQTHTDDKFLGGKLLIRQPVTGFRSGSDAVLLASLVPGEGACKILDVGCGTGVVSLCLAHRLQNAVVTGVDCQEEMIAYAQESAETNGLGNRAQFILEDVVAPSGALEPQSFDHVISNPPYFKDSTESGDKARAVSRSYRGASLEAWLGFCLKMLKPRGFLYFVYPAASLQELMQMLGTSVGGMEVYPLWPNADTPEAKRFLIKARKGVASPSKLCKGLVLHESDGTYTEAARKILWDGCGFEETCNG